MICVLVVEAAINELSKFCLIHFKVLVYEDLNSGHSILKSGWLVHVKI